MHKLHQTGNRRPIAENKDRAILKSFQEHNDEVLKVLRRIEASPEKALSRDDFSATLAAKMVGDGLLSIDNMSVSGKFGAILCTHYRMTLKGQGKLKPFRKWGASYDRSV